MIRRIVTLALMGGLAIPAFAESNLVISSFSQNGELSWSNFPGASQYRIEWAPDLNGNWRDSWSTLNAIPATQTTYTVQVPMFYRLVAVLPDYARSLLHCDGDNGATTFPDATGRHLITAHGDAQVSTAQSRFGGAAVHFDGTGDYLETPNSADFEPGSEAFTVDFWFYPLNNGNAEMLVSKSVPDTGRGYDIRYHLNAIRVVGVKGWADNIISDASVAPGAWYHVAVSSTTNTVHLFINGVPKGTCPRGHIPEGSVPLRLGWTAAYGGNAFRGYLDEFRYSLGIARWTNAFTVPTSPYEDD